MAENNKKEYSVIFLKLEENINSFEKLATHMQSVNERLEKIEEATKQFSEAQKEQKTSTDELTKTQEKLNNFDEAYQKQLMQTKAELADLKSQYATINESLKDFDKSLGNHQREVGNYKIATRDLSAELSLMQKEMMALVADGIDKSSEAYQTLAKKIQETTALQREGNTAFQEAQSASSSVAGVINVFKDMTAVFGIGKSAMALFGEESEKMQESMQKMMAVITALNSLQQVATTLTTKTSFTYKALHAILRLVGIEKKTNAAATAQETAAEAANTATTAANTAATTAQAAATTGATVATTGATVATKLFGKALIATGIGALVVGLGLLLANLDWLKEKILGIFPGLENLKGIIMGVGNVILQYVLMPFKMVTAIIKNIMKGDIKGAINEATQELKNGLNVAGNFKKEFDKEQAKLDEEKLKKQIKDNAIALDKQLDDKIKNANAMYGSDYKFTKDGIELYKKYYSNKKLMYDKDSDDYKNAVNEEITYLREIAEKEKQENDKRIEEYKKAQEKRLADLQKFKDDAMKILEETTKLTNSNDKTQLANQKKNIQKMNVLSKDQLDYKLSLLEKINKEEQELLQKANEKELTAVQQQYDKLIAEAQKLRKDKNLTKAQQQDLDNQILNLQQDRDNRLTEMQRTFNATKAQLNQELTSTITSEQENLNKLTVDSAKRNVTEIEKTLDEGIKNLSTLSTEPSITEGLFNFIDVDKTKSKIDSTISEYQRLATSINEQKQKVADQYDKILQLTAIQYGQDSQQYQDMLNEKKLKTEKFNSDLEIINQRINELQTQNANLQKDYWNSIATEIESKMKTIQETVLGPLFDAFSQLSAMQLEQAQKDLEKTQALHETAVQEITDSQNRINDLNEQIKKASGSRRAELEKNMGAEVKALRQREASEQKLKEETAKLEEDIKKKEAQQRKLDAGKKIIEGVMNTALAVIKALPNIPMSIAVGVLGAIQTGIAIAQYSKLEQGGLLKGASHRNGGIKVPGTNIELEGNEYVINKQSTAKYLPLLEAINNEGKRNRQTNTTIIKQFASGGTIDYELLSELATKSVASVNLTQPYQDNREIVVSVVDIQSGLNRVSNIRDMAGV